MDRRFVVGILVPRQFVAETDVLKLFLRKRKLDSKVLALAAARGDVENGAVVL